MKEHKYALNVKNYKSLIDYLEERGLAYQVDGVYLYIPGNTLVALKRDCKRYIDLMAVFKAKKIPQKQRKEIIDSLQDRHMIVEDGPALVTDKIFAYPQAGTILTKIITETEARRSYIAPDTARRRYGLTGRQLECAVMTGRIRTMEDYRLCEEDIREAIRQDSVYHPFADLVNYLETELNLNLTDDFADRLYQECIAVKFWGCDYRIPDMYLGRLTSDSKNKLYYNPADLPLDKIKCWIRANSVKLDWHNYHYMWANLSDFETDKVCKAYGVDRDQPNENLQPDLHMVMSVMVKEDRDLSVWRVGDIDLIGKTLGMRMKRLLRWFLGRVKDSGGVAYTTYSLNVIEYHKSGTRKTETEPYSIQQYLDFGRLIYAEESFWGENVVDAAIEDSDCARALLQAALCFGAAWRDPDVARMQAPDITDVTGLISMIQGREVDTAVFIRICADFVEQYVRGFKSRKNGQEIRLYLHEDFYCTMGVIITICEYHRIKDGRDSLYASDGINLCTYKKLFGTRYTEIFGEKKLSARRLQKDYLIIQAAGAFGRDYPIRSLGALLAATIRGHKMDFEHGQSTIYHYIPNSTEGMGIDEITVNLFRGGQLCFYKQMVINCLSDEYNNQDLRTKIAIFETLDCTPLQTEQQISAILNIHHCVWPMCADEPLSYDRLKEKIARDVLREKQNANEPYVTCLYEIIYGCKNPACAGKDKCRNYDADDDNAPEKLCRCGIYAKEYIYVLKADKKELMEMQEHLEMMYQQGKVPEEIYRNEKDNFEMAVCYQDDLMFDFLESINDNQLLESEIYAQICKED